MASSITRYVKDRGFETTVGGHVIRSDLPASMGGADLGPTPTELFVASLGSCVSAFVYFYCRRSGLDVRGMRVDVHYDQRNAPGRVTALKVVIALPNEDVTLHRAALRGAAEHCPIGEAIETIEAIDFEVVGSSDGNGAT